MRADAFGLFPRKVTKCRLLFFEKIRFEDFCKTGRNGNSDRWDSVRILFCPAGVQRVLSASGTRLAPTEAERRPEPFVQGMQRGAAPC